MIDLHCHILPFVDDGARNAAMACEMAEHSLRCGVDTVVATPHCNIEYMPGNFRDRSYWEIFGLFKALLKQHHIPLTVLPGAELLAHGPNLEQLLEEERVVTLNNSRYLLTEFNFYTPLEDINAKLRMIRRKGYIPVIAHPERYVSVQEHPGIAQYWVQEGYILQVNKGSILGRLGEGARHTGVSLLRRGLAHAIASDAHDPYHRPTGFRSLTPALRQLCSAEYAQLLLKTNPLRIISDKAVITPDL